MNASFSQQLAEVRQARFGQVPKLRHILQSYLSSSMHSIENREIARNCVLDWARSKWPGLIPPAAYQGEAFEHDQAGLRIAATYNADGSMWAFRSEHLDAQESRTWITEALVADRGDSDALGVRNSCSSMSNEPIPSSIPRFLRDFVSHRSLVDGGVVLGSTPTFIGDPASLDHLVDLLLSEERDLPVIVLSQLQNSNAYAIDPKRIARDVQGLAHVFCIAPAMTYELSDSIGKPLSVFFGGVRTYQPGFSLDDDPWGHHLVLPPKIANWSDSFGSGAGGFEQFLARQIYAASVGTHDKIEQLPSYFSLKHTLLDKPNKTAEEKSESIELQLKLSKASEEAWQQQAMESDQEAKALKDEVRRLSELNQALESENQELRQSRWGNAPLPRSYHDIAEWITSHYPDRLYLHPRAVRGLKDAVFEDITLVCKALKLLAGDYWALKATHDQSQYQRLKQRWEDGLQELRLEYSSNSMAAERLGEYRAAYTIDYRIGEKKQQILGPHLKFGSSKETRFCMRIYFLWDEERQLVVIGSLPAHLENRLT